MLLRFHIQIEKKVGRNKATRKYKHFTTIALNLTTHDRQTELLN